MKLWLTLDSWWTYRIDGVHGCGVWVDEPTFTAEDGWRSPITDHNVTKVGKSISQHPDIERIDNEIMQFFIPDIDLSLERWPRFRQVSDMPTPPNSLRTNFITSYEVSPEKWFEMAFHIGEQHSWEAIHAQKYFELPF